MLPKKERLNLKKDCNKKIFKARNTTNSHFRVHFRKGGSFKAAAVVPVKQVNKAALRNQIKRKIYAVIEQHPIRRQNLHLLVMLISPILDDFKQIEGSLKEILNRLV